jgi:hypothetical protein
MIQAVFAMKQLESTGLPVRRVFTNVMEGNFPQDKTRVGSQVSHQIFLLIALTSYSTSSRGLEHLHVSNGDNFFTWSNKFYS